MDDGGRGRGKDDIFTLPPHPSPHSWPSTAPSVKYCSLFIASGGGGGSVGDFGCVTIKVISDPSAARSQLINGLHFYMHYNLWPPGSP